MTANDAIEQAAQNIRGAYETGMPCEPVRQLLDDGDIDGAYSIQEAVTTWRLDQKVRLVGRKIGLTSVVVQQQLGVDQPDYGMLFDDMAVPDGEEIAHGRVSQPRVEAEIAYVMENDLLAERPTNTEVISACAYAVPAIEVVGSRIKDWDITILDTIADNASSGLFVLGNDKMLLEDFDGRMCGMVVENRGDPIAVGAGAACLGHPINAVRWLAEVMVARGRPLSAGDVVMSGALGPMAPAKPGETYEARINGLGSVRAVFGAEA